MAPLIKVQPYVFFVRSLLTTEATQIKPATANISSKYISANHSNALRQTKFEENSLQGPTTVPVRKQWYWKMRR